MADLCLVFLRSLHIVKYRNALKIFRGKGALLVPTDKKKLRKDLFQLLASQVWSMVGF
jgi:hypothetical protein